VILIDTPSPVRFRRFKRFSHCMSDLPGVDGTAELMAFGRRIGLKAEWIQKMGSETEHFDLFDGAIDRALAAGAVEVAPRELITRVVQPKRAARRHREGGLTGDQGLMDRDGPTEVESGG
jgi:hypothetical protein